MYVFDQFHKTFRRWKIEIVDYNIDSNWWFVIWLNSFDFIWNFWKIFAMFRWNQIMKCVDRRCNKKWVSDFSTWSMQSWCMRFLTIQFVCIYHETRRIWIVNCFSFFRIFFRFCTFYLIEWIRKNKTQSIFEIIDLLMIESKTIDLMIFDSMIVNSMSIDLLTIELIESLIEKSIKSLIKSSIETLIESLVAFEKFVVDWFVTELIEKFLIELICTHVDTSEIDSITIEK